MARKKLDCIVSIDFPEIEEIQKEKPHGKDGYFSSEEEIERWTDIVRVANGYNEENSQLKEFFLKKGFNGQDVEKWYKIKNLVEEFGGEIYFPNGFHFRAGFNCENEAHSYINRLKKILDKNTRIELQNCPEMEKHLKKYH